MKHVLMIPLAGYGHIIPLCQLAQKLSPFHRITFVLPQYLIEDIRTRDLLTETDQLRFHIIQDGYQQNSAFGKTAIQNLSVMTEKFYIPKLMEFTYSLKKAQGAAADPSFAIDLLIVDQFFSMLGVPLYEKNIPVYHFNTSSAAGMHMKGLLIDENCPVWVDEEGSYTIWKAPENSLQPLVAVEKLIFLEMKKNFPLTEGVIVNSFREFELETLATMNSFPVMNGKKVFMVGPLIPKEIAVVSKADNLKQKILEWIGKKEKNSVVYISFGTIMNPPPEQVLEIGKALLLTKKPFVWSLSADRYEYLPEEIKSQIKDQLDSMDSPFLVLPWVPQPLILAHPSAGLFISHCGWNSTMEALSSGIPVIGWPMFAEQGINAQLLAEHGVGLVVEGTGMKPKRIIPSKEIAQLIEEVIGAKNFRQNALKWAYTVNAVVEVGGSSYEDLNVLIKTI